MAGEPPPHFGQSHIARALGETLPFELACVMLGGHKLIVRPDTEEQHLYDLAADPAELVDLARRDDQAERLALMAALIDAWRARSEGPVTGADSAQTDEARRLLEQMGYLGR